MSNIQIVCSPCGDMKIHLARCRSYYQADIRYMDDRVFMTAKKWRVLKGLLVAFFDPATVDIVADKLDLLDDVTEIRPDLRPWYLPKDEAEFSGEGCPHGN